MEMKSVFKLSAVILCSLLAVLSCRKPDDKAVTSFTAVTEGDISAVWTGGVYEFEYSIENATSTGVVSAAAEDGCDWIGNFKTGSYGVVSFEVEENDSENERTATVRLEYEDQSIEFKVIQEGRSIMGNSDLQIEIFDITTSSMRVRITPSDDGMGFVVLTSTMEEMAGFEDDDVLFEDAMNYFRSMASAYQMTLAQVLEQFIETGVYEDTFSGLDSDTEYCVFAFGVNIDGERLTPIARASATTKAVNMVDLTLSLDVNTKFENNTSSVEVKVVPSDTQIPYYYLLLDQFSYDIYGKGMPEAVEGYMKYILNYYTYQGIDAATLYKMYSNYGVQTFRNELEPKTNYWAAAFAWDSLCNIASEVFWEEFKAPGVESDNKISLQVKEVGNTTARVVVSVSNDDPYYVGVEPAWRVAGMDDEYLMWSMVDFYDIASMTVTGNTDRVFSDLAPDTEYVAIAFGFEGGSYSTALSKVTFRTSSAGDPSQCSFTFDIANLKARSVDITVTPSDQSVSYHWDLFEASMTEEDLREFFQENIDFQIGMGYIADALEYWQLTAIRGTDRYSFSLSPSTEYRVMAVAIDMTTGDYGGDFYFSEPFTSPDPVVSDAYVELDCSKYYDGDELYAADSKYEAFRGKAYLYVNCGLTGPVQHWYHSILTWNEAYADLSVYTDEVIIDNFVYGGLGQLDLQTSQWIVPYDTEMFALAVAVDADGNYGKVFRQRFTLTRDGVSPVEDIIQSGQRTREALQAQDGLSGEVEFTGKTLKALHTAHN